MGGRRRFTLIKHEPKNQRRQKHNSVKLRVQFKGPCLHPEDEKCSLFISLGFLGV